MIYENIMSQVIETARTVLRPFTTNDIDTFAKICTNPNVMRYIGDDKPVPHAIIANKMTSWIELYEKQGYGLMALILQQTNELIGFCGFINQVVDEVSYVELGYRLDEPYWGQGLATEAALAVKEYAFNCLDIPLLISIIHHQNTASKRVAQKVGMQLMQSTKFNNIDVDVFWVKKEVVS